MGGMVTGLLIQTVATAMGKLQPTATATAAETTICDGNGMNDMNKPIANAHETEWRFKCQRFGLFKRFPNSLCIRGVDTAR